MVFRDVVGRVKRCTLRTQGGAVSYDPTMCLKGAPLCSVIRLKPKVVVESTDCVHTLALPTWESLSVYTDRVPVLPASLEKNYLRMASVDIL